MRFPAPSTATPVGYPSWAWTAGPPSPPNPRSSVPANVGNRLIHHPSPTRADVGKRRNPARVRPSQGEQELESDNQALASRVAERPGTVPHALVRRVPRRHD